MQSIDNKQIGGGNKLSRHEIINFIGCRYYDGGNIEGLVIVRLWGDQ